MRIATAHPFQFDMPTRTAKTGNAKILAGTGGDAPAGEGGRAFGGLLWLRCSPEDEGADPGSLGGQLQTLRGRRAIFGDLADHAAEPRMSQTFLHGEQHIRVAAGFDIDHPVRVQPSKMQRGREQVAPPQAP